jgi:hypothetical protein
MYFFRFLGARRIAKKTLYSNAVTTDVNTTTPNNTEIDVSIRRSSQYSVTSPDCSEIHETAKSNPAKTPNNQMARHTTLTLLLEGERRQLSATVP